MYKLLLATSLIVGAIGLSKPCHAQWYADDVIVDHVGQGVDTPYSTNEGFQSGDWLTQSISLKTVAHDSVTLNGSYYQGSSRYIYHEMLKTYRWTLNGYWPDDIHFPVHGEISGSATGGYANASSSIGVTNDNSSSTASWLSGSKTPWNSSYSLGKDEVLYGTGGCLNVNKWQLSWTLNSFASGGRPNSNGFYNSWSKALFYSGDAETEHCTIIMP